MIETIIYDPNRLNNGGLSIWRKIGDYDIGTACHRLAIAEQAAVSWDAFVTTIDIQSNDQLALYGPVPGEPTTYIRNPAYPPRMYCRGFGRLASRWRARWYGGRWELFEGGGSVDEPALPRVEYER